MAFSAGAVSVDIRTGKNEVKPALQSLGSLAKSIGGKIAGALAVTGFASFTKDCVGLASDLAEVQNVVDVTFSSMSGKVNEWAKDASAQFGLSETMAKQYVGTFGSMAEAFGFTEQQAYDMSTALTGLAGDVASFYNISQDMAYTKLKSVFSGETETLKDLGIVMTQSALDAYALSEGYGKATKSMTEQEKVALRLAFVQGQLANATGDFARTSGSWANQTRLLQLRFDTLKATLGQAFIVALLPIVKAMNAIILAATRAAESIGKFVEAITGKPLEELTGGASGAGAAMVELGASSDDAADSTGSLTDAQKKAADAAKKQKKAQEALNRTLAGFDKINKLASKQKKEKTDSSSGMSDLGIPDAASQVADLDSAIADVKPPTPLVAAFERLRDVIGRVAEAGKTGLSWVYENILKPLGEWTLNTLAPKLVDMLATALDALRSVCEALAPAFAAVWSNVLKPLAAWAGERVISLIEYVTAALRGLADFAGKHPKAFTAIAAGLTAMLGVHKHRSGFMKMFTWLLSGSGLRGLTKLKFGPKLTNVTKIAKNLFKVVGKNPIVAVIAAVAAGVLYLYKNWDKIKNTKVGQSITRLVDKLKPLAEKLEELGSKVIAKVADGVAELGKSVEPLIEKVGPFIEQAADLLVDGLCAAIDGLCDALDAAEGAIEGIREAWDWLKDKTVTLTATAVNALGSAWDAICGAWDWLKDKAATITGKAKEALGNAWDTICNAWDWLKDKAATITGNAKNALGEAWNAIKSAWDWLKDKTASLIAQAKNNLGNVWAAIQNAWNGFKDKAATLVAYAKNAMGKVYDGIRSVWNNFRNVSATLTAKAKNRLGATWKKIQSAWRSFRDKAATLTARFVDFFSKPLKKAWNALAGAVNKGIGVINNITGLKVPKLPQLAQGGYVARNTPRLAVIGDNRREGEIVSPESKLQAMADQAARGNSSTGAVEALLRELIAAVQSQDRAVYLDGKLLTRKVVENVNNQTMASGRCPIVV